LLVALLHIIYPRFTLPKDAIQDRCLKSNTWVLLIFYQHKFRCLALEEINVYKTKKALCVFLFTALAVTGLGLAPSFSEAVTLNTDALLLDPAHDIFADCVITNLTQETIAFSFTLVGPDGAVINTGSGNLGPGGTEDIVGTPSTGGFCHCRFTMKSSTGVRASMSLFQFNGSFSLPITISEAR
jgi:hypothetical protein